MAGLDPAIHRKKWTPGLQREDALRAFAPGMTISNALSIKG
jgi:hypothetical protein